MSAHDSMNVFIAISAKGSSSVSVKGRLGWAAGEKLQVR